MCMSVICGNSGSDESQMAEVLLSPERFAVASALSSVATSFESKLPG
jgi:hypothetical protein